ncbi:uncharacterized protein isoform X2 [Leptinotarsa decemlineata]|uniref:uncharacterized protein isoform X2 n=1 Tax=Leptinotarsa decemlineata TaxID=7539 RepID=UPI003D30A741
MTKNQSCSESNSPSELSNLGAEKSENIPEDINEDDTNRISWTPQTGRASSQTTLSTTEGGSSSSSSLGWSDEYEGSTTKKVFEELKRMDRVLRGVETVPPHYDVDEYEQWMNKFPNISIFDSNKTPVNSTQNINEKLGNEINISSVFGSSVISSRNCDISSSNKNNPRKKLTPMRASEISPSILLNQRGANITRKKSSEESRHKNKNIFTVFNKTKSWDSEKYLKISSISSILNERKHSSKSLLSRQVSKEYQESSLEFGSLPFIEVEEPPSVKSSRHYNKQSATSRKNPTGDLVLPPIDVGDHFRSISATPRQPVKTFSALSVNSNILLERKKVKRKSLNVFLETPVSSDVQRNNFFR